MYLYQFVENHIKILGYRGYDRSIRIPEKIDNWPVEELSAYAFSEGWGRRNMLALAGNGISFCDDEGNPITVEDADMPPEIDCELLQDLYLPKTIKKIGNYAFYNCFQLSHIECYSSIFDLGSGLFTGCTGVRFLDIHMTDEKNSCLKEILSELHQELYVNYYGSNGTARLVFPEMFEESVEHTPARIIIREMHGCGHMYRYCFDHREFQFQKYDALFPHILVQESERVVLALVCGRLFSPVNLFPQDQKVYQAYLKEHLAGAGALALEEEDPSLFLWLIREFGNNKKDFDDMIDLASKANKTELLSILMELRRQRFPAEKRAFSL